MSVDVEKNEERLQEQEVDLPLDWLYKGRRRTTPVLVRDEKGPVTATEPKPDSQRQSQSQPQSRLRSRSKSITLSNVARPKVIGRPVDHLYPGGPSNSKNGRIGSEPDYPELARVASSEAEQSSTTLPPRILTTNIQRSSSVSEKHSSSIFSALFGKRNVASPSSAKRKTDTPPLRIRVPSATAAGGGGGGGKGTPSSRRSTPLIKSPLPRIITKARSPIPSSKTHTYPLSPAASLPHNTNELPTIDASIDSTPTMSPISRSGSTSSTASDVLYYSSAPHPQDMKKVHILERMSKYPLKSVAFAVDKIEGEPSQQLPSRRPRRGDILVPDDMISDTPLISVGITRVSESGGSIGRPFPKYSKDSKEYKMAMERYKRMLKQSAKHQSDANRAAEKLSKEVRKQAMSGLAVSARKSATPVGRLSGNEKKSSGDGEPDDAAIISNERLAQSTIDKPLKQVRTHHGHRRYYDCLEDPFAVDGELTADIIYTRCCHLREILPVPSSLKQLVGRVPPIQTYKFLNPKPTLIDILSICDFLSIVPVNNVIFDNVLLTSKMFKTLLASLVNSTSLVKLGLKNSVMEAEDWGNLCSFLLRNKSIRKLDISQTRARLSTGDSSSYRENMDWQLLVDVLNIRTGKPLEELLLNGVKVSNIPLDMFMGLLNTLGLKSTKGSALRLGLSMSDIDKLHLKFLFNWISRFNVQGADLSNNDLGSLVPIIVDKLSLLNYDCLRYFTLNNTEIRDVGDITRLLEQLSRLPNLRFLDLSRLPQLFPATFHALHKFLPKFPKLEVISMESNSLSYKQLAIICNILIECKHLTHISLAGQSAGNNDNTEETPEHQAANYVRNAYWAALYGLARSSKTLVNLDVDYNEIPEELQSRIALCLMRNTKQRVNTDLRTDVLATQDDLLFGGSLISETAGEMLKKLNSVEWFEDVHRADPDKLYLMKKYIEALCRAINNIQDSLDITLSKGGTENLSHTGKENIIRLLLLKKNLTNILQAFSGIPLLADMMNFDDGSSLGSVDKESSDLEEEPHSMTENMVTNEKHHDTSTKRTTSSETKRRPLIRMSSDFLLSRMLSTQDSDEPVSEPHPMATDADSIVDVVTGESIQDAASSTISLAGKIQEEEEGELHKWGYFVQKRNLDSNPPTSPPLGGTSESLSPTTLSTGSSDLSPTNLDIPISPTMQAKLLSKIPTGNELREAIIEAKGVHSIDDLIKDIAKNDNKVENIYDLFVDMYRGETPKQVKSDEP